MPITRVLRYALIPATMLLAAVTAWSAVVVYWRSTAPQRLLRLIPNDAIAVMANLNRQMAQEADPMAASRNAQGAARQALREMPLNPIALRVLGVGELAENRTPQGLRLLKLSERISRREIGTRIALIEYYSATDNVPAAFHEYDLALSTSNGAGEVLFPILTNALDVPEIRSELVRYVRAGRPWLRSFLDHATTAAPNPELLADLIIRAGGLPRDADFRQFETQLLARLNATHRTEALRQYYLTLPGASAALLRTVAVNAETTNPAIGPLAWSLAETPEVSALRGDAGELMVRVASGSRGVATQRLLFLAPGSYRLSSSLAFTDGEGEAIWEMRCAARETAEPIWRREANPSNASAFTATVEISADCPAQTIALVVSGGLEQVDTNITVGAILVSKIN